MSLQPVHKRNGDVTESNDVTPTEEDDVFPEGDLLFNSDDEESQAEDDGWFDQLIQDNLSLGLEAASPGPLPAPDDSQHPPLGPCGDVELEEFEFDTQIRGEDTFSQLDAEVAVPQHLAKSVVDDLVVRPVARPLTSEEPLSSQPVDKAIIEDDQLQTPTRTPAKTVIESVTSSPDPSPAQPSQAEPLPDHLPDDSRAKRIAELQAQIALLESMQSGVKSNGGLGDPGGLPTRVHIKN